MKRHPLTTPPATPWPQIWLFSDERLENPLLQVAACLPVGSGVVLRHDGLALGARYRLARRLMRLARARRLVILLAGDAEMARRWGVHGVHLRHHLARSAHRGARRGMILSMPVHDRTEALRARKMAAELVFISPLHSTRSHEGTPALGEKAWLRLAQSVGGAKIAALGGMNLAAARALNRRAGALRNSGRIGWAAIDALDARCSAKRARRRAAMQREI